MHARAHVLKHLSPARLRQEPLLRVAHRVANKVDPGCDDGVDVADDDHKIRSFLQQHRLEALSGGAGVARRSGRARSRPFRDDGHEALRGVAEGQRQPGETMSPIDGA